jgi:hypothetical protein
MFLPPVFQPLRGIRPNPPVPSRPEGDQSISLQPVGLKGDSLTLTFAGRSDWKEGAKRRDGSGKQDSVMGRYLRRIPREKEVDKLPDSAYSGYPGSKTLKYFYNGPDRPLFSLLPTRRQEEFRQLLKKRQPALGYGQEIETWIKAFGMQTPLGREVLYQMVERLDLKTLRGLRHVMQQMGEVGLIKKGDPQEPYCNWLLLCTHLLESGKGTLSDLQVIPQQMASVIQEGPQEKADQNPDATTERFYTLELMNTALQAYIDPDLCETPPAKENVSDPETKAFLARFTSESAPFSQRPLSSYFSQLTQQMVQLGETIQSLSISDVPAGEIRGLLIQGVANMLPLTASDDMFFAELQSLRSALGQPSLSPDGKKALFTLLLKDWSLGSQAWLLTCLNDYAALGGNVSFLAKLAMAFHQAFPTSTLTLESSMLADLKEIEPAYSQAEDLDSFVRALKSPFRDPPWAKSPIQAAHAHAQLTRFFPADAPLLIERDMLIKSGSEEVYQERLKSVEALLGDIQDDAMLQQAAIKMLLPPEALPDAIAVKNLMKQLSAYTDVYTGEEAYLRREAILTQLIQLKGDSTVGPLTRTGFETMSRVLEERADRLEQDPVLRRLSPLITLKLLSGVLKGSLPAHALGACFDQWATMAQQLPEAASVFLLNDLHHAYSRHPAPYLALRKKAFPLHTLPDSSERLQYLHRRLGEYMERLPSGHDATPMMMLLGFLNAKGMLKDWEIYLNGFEDALLEMTAEDRENFFRNDHPAAALLEAAVSGYQQSKERSAPDWGQAFVPLYTRAYQHWKALTEENPELAATAFLKRLLYKPYNALKITVDTADLDAAVQAYRALKTPEIPMPEKLSNARVIAEKLHPITPWVHTMAMRFMKQGGDPDGLVRLLTHPAVIVDNPVLRNFILDDCFPLLLKNKSSQYLEEFPKALIHLHEMKLKHPQMKRMLAEVIAELPDRWREAAQSISDMRPEFFNQLMPAEEYAEGASVPPEVLASVRQAVRPFSMMHHPRLFLNTYLMNHETLPPEVLNEVLFYTEFQEPSKQVGLGLLPELLALFPLHLQRLRNMDDNRRNLMINQASTAVTSFYGYLEAGVDSVRTINSEAMNNWSRAATLGLSYPKWQYDTMRRWKGMGPQEQPSLFQASGLFQPLPARASDTTFHGGYFLKDPKTNLAIEFRRAYMAISHPKNGTLIIRNSSPVFGRDLLPELAYFHPKTSFGTPEDLIDIETLERQGFHSVLDRDLHQTPQMQEQHHTQIAGLLEMFDTAMEPYIQWKCGFQGGQAPEGFKGMLTAALASAQNGGQGTPFGKRNNIKLAWVDRYGLPYTILGFDLSQPALQQEAAFYLDILNKRRTVADATTYQQQMPNLLAFLKEGLSQNLELVLTE